MAKEGIRVARKQLARVSLLCLMLVAALLCTACGNAQSPSSPEQATQEPSDTSRFIVAIEEEPDTVDFQCTSIHYTIATNVFDRLVEMKENADGVVATMPSLAASWEESTDGRTYTFHLRDGVTFSNGAKLTSSDVLYSLKRLLTHPDSCNQDIAEPILGANDLEAGKVDKLEGFHIIDDLNFSIILEQPFEAFLACLSMPGASILDEETTTQADALFGKDAAHTIGTGPFILKEWTPGKEIQLLANEKCWSGAPRSGGVKLLFITDDERIRKMFDKGELHILDLDDQGNIESLIHGDIYRDRIQEVPQIGISYIALNESKAPLNDVRVRKALQYSLDRDTLLNAVYSGRGSLEHGIFSRGLYGFNPSLPPIPYDRDLAHKLLEEAGLADGFDLTFSVKSSSTQWDLSLAEYAIKMWKELGVNASLEVIDENEWMSLRKSGELACYTATWTADYNDPDNFIFTFFGNQANTMFRSLCYPKTDVMDRVRNARAITDRDRRLQEYQDLEKIIVQDDAAWIPLFSRTRLYVTSERLEGFQHAWNGSVKNVYREMSVKQI